MTDVKEIFNKAEELGYRDDRITAKTQELSIYYTLCDIQKWIRNEHKVNIEIIGFVDGSEENICYFYHLRDMTKYSTYLELPNTDESYNTYKECLEMALYKSLTLIKERNDNN